MLALIALFPLIGFAINGSWYAFFQAPQGRTKSGATIPGIIATTAIGLSFLVSLLLFFELKGLPADNRVLEQVVFNWMNIGGFSLDVAFRLDPLSSLFTLFVTGVATLIHLYSIGYMSHDATPGKFFSYLNLFSFAMLMLILGANLPIMFLGWEGVGLCSYLLIGYWYADMEKASAGKKAFIVNRVGDFGFLLAMFMIFEKFGTLDMSQLRVGVFALAEHGHQLAAADLGIITAICILLFVGAMGKSAQIPLYVWLPDAMAGPTPVSALIHAATMVTSGIYMVARLNFMYNLSPTALEVVAIIGGATAFFAATIAIAQKDIKKVLAYSTVSQLGYMFLGCGVGAYAAGVSHVITHAFFKALLFLGAGSVIHGMHEEQDITKMGGLRSKMPKTFLTFAAGWLAICGIPPFSGFFSKDEILWQAYASPHGSKILWALGAMTAVMTAFYMTRLFYLTFLGTPRFKEANGDDHGKSHGHDVHSENKHAGIAVHESPMVMVLPLQILGVLSIIGGFIAIPHMSWIEHWLDTVIPAHDPASLIAAPSMEWVLMSVSVVGAALGIFVGFKLYADLKKAEELKLRFAGLNKLLENKWYIDELYEATIVRPIHALSVGLWKGFDIAVIDRTVLGFGRVSQWSGQALRVIQTGSLQHYALVLLMGLIASVGYLLYGLA
ncbi:MAG: NADH-quinone oxidoreductase subunit L [Bdellovibrionales bacterium GWC1_52_8]|nr:MAG: NADH-quinone oxidoreductase subunit L [Bdellovibrionales bacterium GWB1_52_6]OFZ04460.1 MAG: NADH-quinone oxidoreductase subunit L [Bdellovibrionales bacterium GWA1_52_35]OFZ38394.1 MAG: NADH-quinone oxidoreductase subunit L [Bdellovibrionales bacterium GWC1_52_8]HCM40678.1 NADH-quinone oxidoreductase subunit L [Bdellovibrionales bacterium]